MKSLTASLLFLFFCGTVSGQICTPDTSMTNPGLEPVPDSLACFVQGDTAERTVYFKNYDKVDFAGFQPTVEWIQIDHVYNLPCGIRWTTNKKDAANPHRFQNLEEGCIKLKGMTNDPPGQYKLDMRVTAKLDQLSSPISGINADTVGLRYDVRVKANPGDTCIPVDTSIAGNTASCDETPWEEDTVTTIGNNKINQASQLEVNPNPFLQEATLSFNSDRAGQYQLRVYNMLGENVRTRNVTLKKGQNALQLRKGDLKAGMYILRITNQEGGTVSKKLMIGQDQ